MAEEQRALLGAEGGDGCGGSPGPPRALPAACDPRRLPHRLLVLALMCFLGFGSYFCYDNPAALQTQVQRLPAHYSSCFSTLAHRSVLK